MALWLALIGFCASPMAAQAVSADAHAKTAPTNAKHARVRPDVARFSARVDSIFADNRAQKAYWGVLVADRDTGEALFELNADRLFTPASNAKIFTSALALSTLGSDFHFRTTLETTGQLGSDGRLIGDLVFVGRGDPELSNRKIPYVGKVEREGPTEKVLAEMADAAIAKGLKEVNGDIVADDRYFPYDPYPAGWSVGDLYFTFGAPISAIAFNDNSISIEVSPGEHEGDPAVVLVDPAAARDTFTQEIATSFAGGKPDFAVVRQPGANFVLLRGSIPIGHAPIKLDLAMMEPGETTALTLGKILEARGVMVKGTVRISHAPPPQISPDGLAVLGPAPPETAANTLVLAEHISPPLVEIIRVMNKVSQNLHAELLLRAVAREKKGFGVTDAGIWAEQDFLKSIGVVDGDVVLSDGSGLSRDDLVTPRAVVQVLRYVSQQPWGADYISTFPISGIDGTLENRMKGTTASGLIAAKTGSLEHVHAMSGYATTLRGERLVFSIFGNNDAQHGRDVTAAIDAIGAAMVETLGKPAPTKKKK
jgi:serine-type D-Ala-D-Ala carboxypeptidase/endopeptidase (penicillin-binding protein 4)